MPALAISQLPSPATITGLERIPALQDDGNAGLPLFALGTAPSGQVLALQRPYLADTATTADADPGAGNVRWNHATQTAATVIYVDDVDTAAADLAALLATLQVGGYLHLQGEGQAGAGTWQSWEVTAITDAVGYTKIGVSLVASSGVAFVDDAAVLLSVQQPTPDPGVDRNVVSALATSGSVAINCDLGDYFTLALAGNVTGFTFSNLPAAGKAISLMVRITQDATARTVAWPASFKWAGGTPGAVSTTAGAIDVLALTTFNQGTTWLATLAKAFA
jgi:hypothetical protein